MPTNLYPASRGPFDLHRKVGKIEGTSARRITNLQTPQNFPLFFSAARTAPLKSTLLIKVLNLDQLLGIREIRILNRSFSVKGITVSPLFLCLFAFVIFLSQGEKGEKGSQGKDGGVPRQGPIKIGDTADICILGTAGTVRYNPSQNALQLCDGSAWLSVVTAGKGHVAYTPGRHCLDILKVRIHGAILRAMLPAMAELHRVSTLKFVARNIAAVESRPTSATLRATNFFVYPPSAAFRAKV